MSLLTRLAAGSRSVEVPQRAGVRAPKAGTANIVYTNPGQPMPVRWDAKTAIEGGYLAHPAVYSAVRTVAETIAALPFRAGKDPNDAGNYDVNCRLAQLLGPAPYGPNPTTTSRALWAWSVSQRLVTGRMGWELERGKNSNAEILNLWPLISHNIKPIPTGAPAGQAQGTKYFQGFRYQLPDGWIDIPPERLFYSWRPSQSDWRQPETVMQAAQIPIAIAVALNQYQWGMLKNGMSGRKMIVHSPFEEPAEERAWQDQFLSEMTGFNNAGRPIFTPASSDVDELTGKVVPPVTQVIDLNQNNTDAQLMQLMEYIERAIYKAFSVPESEIGDASHRTYSNAGEEYRVFWTRTIVPLCKEIADDINTHLAPLVGEEVGWFDFSGVDALKPAGKFAQDTPGNLVRDGIITAGEYRIDVGLPYDLPLTPEEGTQEPVAVTNVDDPGIEASVHASAYDRARTDEVLAGVRKAIEAARHDYSSFGPGPNWITKVGQLPLYVRDVAHALVRAGHSESEAIEMAIGVIKSWAAGEKHVHPDTQAKAMETVAEWEKLKAKSHLGRSPEVLTDLQKALQETRIANQKQAVRSAHYRVVDRHATAVETQMTAALKTVFDEQRTATISRLEGRRGAQMMRAAEQDPQHVPDADSIFQPVYWLNKTKNAIQNVFRAIGGFTPSHVNAQLGAPEVDDTGAVHTLDHFLDNATTRIAQQTTHDTAMAIHDALHEGIVAGEGVPALTDRVNHVFDEADRTRAERIARTEVMGAVNGAQESYARALPGDVVDKKEWLATPDERTRVEHREANAQKQPMEVPYSVGGEQLMYPGDPVASPHMRINCRCTQLFIPKE